MASAMSVTTACGPERTRVGMTRLARSCMDSSNAPTRRLVPPRSMPRCTSGRSSCGGTAGVEAGCQRTSGDAARSGTRMKISGGRLLEK